MGEPNLVLTSMAVINKIGEIIITPMLTKVMSKSLLIKCVYIVDS